MAGDGMIEYLGRNDHQVKIRGYRIELGEIEAQLARHRAVKEAVAVVRENLSGERYVVAYVTPCEQSAPSAEGLIAHLRALLPEHMVPNAFVVLDRLPLTPNGKLDRRALPAPERDAYVSRQYESPRTDVEQILAETWQELLPVERIGRQDNFFELGGHSLLAMQVMVRIRSSLSIDVPISALFKFPTLDEFSAHVEDVRQASLLENLAKAGMTSRNWSGSWPRCRIAESKS